MQFSDYQSITFRRDGRVLHATLNRQETLNAFDDVLEQDIARLFPDAGDDPETNVLVLTGAGRAFSAGGDIEDMQRLIDRPECFLTNMSRGKRIVYSILDCPKPIIAKINGAAIGLGATIALFCDIVIAANHAKIADPHVKVGLVAGDGGAAIWPQLIGYARAKHYLLTGDTLTGEEAARIGLISRAVPAEELDRVTDELAQRLATGASHAIQWTKQSVNVRLRQVVNDVIEASFVYEALSNGTKDHQEAVNAFREATAAFHWRVTAVMVGRPRAVYRHSDLDRFLNPKSIAIVGASPRPGSFGARLQSNLAAYDGRVYPVNAKYGRLDDLKCYPSLSDLPEAPDCVAIAVAREVAESVVEEAAQIGAGGVIVYASGYAETRKPDWIAAQRRLSEISRTHGLPIMGPNCLGMANYLRRARITFAEYPAPRLLNLASAVGIVGQSGALSQALAQAAERGASVSHVFAPGNQCDLDVADYVAYLAQDESCRSIVCVFEGMDNPARLLEAAEIAWRTDIPLLVHKIATGRPGAEAAIAHTASLAGSDAAYRAAFDRVGAIVIEEFEGLMEAAAFFAKAPKPKAKGVAVLATSGGAAIMAADQAEFHGVPLPPTSSAVRAVLEAHIPEYGSARNPCDVTAQVITNPQSLAACGDALMGSDAYGAVVVPQPVAYDLHTPRIGVLSELSQRYGKITCNVLVSEWLQGPGTIEAESDLHVALFRSMKRCFGTLAAWNRRHERQQSPPRAQVRLSSIDAARDAAALLERSPGRTLTGSDADAVLAAYGIPLIRSTSPNNVAHMAVTPGLHLQIRTRVDSLLGPLIFVGIGGEFVRLPEDAAAKLAPVTHDEAQDLIDRLRRAAHLNVGPGAEPSDVKRLCDVICRFSELAADLREHIEGIVVNPLICSSGRVVAAGASFSLAKK